MKILRISLSNLASLEGTQTVDFTREPLRSTGLFSISGPTGSGKSTLLDALCLALYEKTPRLNAVRGSVKLADAESEITQSDPANLLRRGTGRGFAEVAFIGVDQGIYTARWSVHRARNRPEGSLQQTEVVLFKGNVTPGTEGVIAQGGRKSEVLPVIEEKVGLSFKQFTRAVLLAQNDFATFLKAADQERAEILQALTGTERFEEISKAVFARCAGELKALEAIAAQLAGNPALGADERLAAEQVLATCESARRDALEKLAARESHAAWFLKLAELLALLETGRLALETASLAREQAAPRKLVLAQTEEASREARPLREAELRTAAALIDTRTKRDGAAGAHRKSASTHEQQAALLFAAESALTLAREHQEKARPDLERARTLDAQLTPLKAALEKAMQSRVEAEAAANEAHRKFEAKKTERSELQSERETLVLEREKLAIYSPFASDAAAWSDRLARTTAAHVTLKNAREFLAQRTSEEAGKIAQATRERDSEPDIRAAAASAFKEFENAEAQFQSHDAEKIAAARSAADSARAALQGLREQLKNCESLDARASECRVEIAKLTATKDADSLTLADVLQTQIPAAERELEAARRAEEITQAAVTDATLRLREILQTREACPVCGSLEHPYSAHGSAPESAALAILRAGRLACEKALHTLRHQASTLEAHCKLRGGQIEEKAGALKTLEVALTQAQSATHEHPEALAILACEPAARLNAIASRLDYFEGIRGALEKADAARRGAEKQRDTCRKAHEKAAATLGVLEKLLSRLDSEIGTAKMARENAWAAQTAAEDQVLERMTALDVLFLGLPAGRADFESNAAIFQKAFAHNCAQLLKIQARHAELSGAIHALDSALVQLAEAHTGSAAALASRRLEETQANGNFETIRQQRAALFLGRAAAEIESQLAAAFKAANEKREACAAALSAAAKELAACVHSLELLEKALLETEAANGTAIEALSRWLGAFESRHDRPLDRPILDAWLARETTWFKAEQAALDALEQQVSSAKGALAVHEENLHRHRHSRPTEDEEPAVLADLLTLRAAKTEAEAQRDSASLILRADDDRLRHNAELNRQHALKDAAADPWRRLNELIGSADGAKFRAIAQRRTLDILLGYANAQLDQLAARYRLERIPESLNLLVLDRDMGDERRSIHSLSGGESFLVSLALALALASLTSNRLRIESLFIDEGFGSLDPATLNIAMGALMHLEAQGRKVGVISHVSEMADAIPVQIRVIKGRSGASRLEVPGAAPYVEPAPEAPPAAIAHLAEQCVAILKKHHAEGTAKVSAVALRKELGCSPEAFQAVRDLLGQRLVTEGRSLSLAG